MTGKIAEHCSAGRPPGIYYILEEIFDQDRNTRKWTCTYIPYIRKIILQKWLGKNLKEQDRTINLNCTWKRGKKMLHLFQFQPISSNHALCVSRPNNIFF